MMKKLLILAIVVSVLLSVLQLNLAIGCEEQAPGSITVHKFHDLNNNGAQDDGEQDIEVMSSRAFTIRPSVGAWGVRPHLGEDCISRQLLHRLEIEIHGLPILSLSLQENRSLLVVTTQIAVGLSHV